jgi:hypothetical protein
MIPSPYCSGHDPPGAGQMAIDIGRRKLISALGGAAVTWPLGGARAEMLSSRVPRRLNALMDGVNAAAAVANVPAHAQDRSRPSYPLRSRTSIRKSVRHTCSSSPQRSCYHFGPPIERVPGIGRNFFARFDCSEARGGWASVTSALNAQKMADLALIHDCLQAILRGSPNDDRGL